VVSIHAIATFQALHDYLRPRVAGLLSSSRLSGMFAALAASGFVGSTSKPADDSSKAAKPTDSGAESSAAAAPAAIQRRRSQRLSAKQAGSSSGGEVATETNADSSLLIDASTLTAVATSDASSTLEAVLAPVEPALGNNVIDSGLAADFTDDEDDVDAEVFDDEVDPDTSLSEKTVTVSVVEGLIN
jgi:E3 ubiquitin-protein ligase TRIP12